MTKIYQYPNCSSCKKALKFLSANGVNFDSINIVDTPPSKKELKTMLESYSGEIKKLFNTSGQVYREMKIKDKIDSLSKNDAIDLLNANGKLIKRPFLLDKKTNLVGFKEETWKQELL